jgi:hypothetical protein
VFPKSACIALCVLTIACSGSSAPTAPPPSAPPALATFALTGHVADLDTGRPLIGAAITILDGRNASRTTTADGSGAFRMTDVMVGGFTVRVMYTGYDSVYRGITFVADTSIEVQLRPAMQTLAGTWAGTLSFSRANGAREDVAIPQLTMMHSGSSVSATFLTSGPYQASFTGTLRDPSSMASTTVVTGTMTLTLDLSGRGPLTCKGTSDFTGTVNWTEMVMTAPQVAFECATTFTNVVIALVRR